MLRNDLTTNIHVLKAENTAAPMMYLSGIICFLLTLTVEARVGNSTDYFYCLETQECLHFEWVCGTKDYEVRHYYSAQWVATDFECYFSDFAAMKAFDRLHKYITGNNEEGLKIEMTSPVITKVMKTPFWKPNKYTISLLLPSEFQMNAPKPMDDTVYLNTTSSMYVYVKSYGGWATSFMDKIKSYFFSCDLDKYHANYNKEFHYSAVYNSPMTIMNRHNEVWMEAEGVPDCYYM